jgi:hypothetical protein
MLKNLLTLAAAAVLSVTASAGTVDIMSSLGTSGDKATYDSSNKTITFTADWGCCGWWLSDTGVDYSDYQSVVIKFAEPASATVQLSVEYVNADTQKEIVSSGATQIECEFDKTARSAVKQMYLQLAAAGDLVISEAYLVENEPEVEYDTVELNLSNDNHNLLLSEYKDYDDDLELDVYLTISSASGTGVGWGVGTILRISDYSKSVYDFSAKAVSEEGAENKYKFTVGQFKEFAKLEDGTYWVDEWGQSGLSFNLYNGASMKGISILVPKTEAPKEEVLFEGSETYKDWYPGFTFPKADLVKAGAGAKLVIEVEYPDTETSWSYKLSTNYTNTVLPSFTAVSTYNEVSKTAYSVAKTVTHEITAEDIEVLKASDNYDDSVHITMAETTVLKKVTLVYPTEEAGVNFVEVSNDENAPVEYFNLQGVRVSNPANGLYIRRQGSKSSKILIK